MLVTDEKTQKIEPDPNLFKTDKNSKAGYFFFYVQNIRMKISECVCNDLNFTCIKLIQFFFYIK